MKGEISMSMKELERIKTLTLVRENKLSQVIAAKRLKISDRQVRNLLKQIEQEGDKGIISKKRGRLSNHRLPENLKQEVIKLVREQYVDFGPTLVCEYLKAHHSINLSSETIRLWMIEAGIWSAKIRRARLHPLRERKPAFGELTQIDGSQHHWFEDRAPPCVLMVCIDDATSMLTSLYFSETECLEAYFQALAGHLRVYGVPLAIYGDRCSSLVPRLPVGMQNTTQFNQALKELGVELILANSPQAKGRVERANRTLQDRLVKYLRYKNICSIEEANKVLEEFRREYNFKFSKKPSEQCNAHRLLDGFSVESVLSTRATRILSKDNTIQFENTFYQIISQDPKIRLYKGGKIEIRTHLDGKQEALFGKKPVRMVALSQVDTPILDRKQILVWEDHKKFIPNKDHPYKKHFQKTMENHKSKVAV